MRRLLVFSFLMFSLSSFSQYNVDRLMSSGEIALHYEDYVLSVQYFNRAISQKPFLYQAWLLRGAAKFYLDDFVGAEQDASEAIKLNPYIDDIFDLRAITRIRQEKYKDAVDDYTHAININQNNRNYWFNRAVCLMSMNEYDKALLQTDTIISKWKNFANAYTLQAEVYLHKKDTTSAAKSLDRSLEIDPYDADAWSTRAYISLSRHAWRDADNELSKVIHLKPNLALSYINRALARLNYNNLRGAMDDYDKALEIAPNNFLGHYNRGLLRMQLGDNNRAITDFNYVIQMNPKDFLAIFNRAILLDKTGDLHAAIRDYTSVIHQFPNFWTGLSYRAGCYRRLGMTAKAELDEFRIFKAQMNKHIGIQPRWSRNKAKSMRKRTEIDPEKFADIVVDSDNTVEHEYKSEYRGHVQNRSVEISYMPLYELSYIPYNNGVKSYQVYCQDVEDFNKDIQNSYKIYVSCNPGSLSEAQSSKYFDIIDRLSATIAATHSEKAAKKYIFQRAVAYSVLQNFDAAINDITVYLQIDSTSALAYWQRGVCQVVMNEFNSFRGTDGKLKAAGVISDFEQALKISPNNAFLYYNLGTVRVKLKDYTKAITDFTKAIKLDPSLAEAYFNRGLAYIENGNKSQGINDLSKAGELGLYKAYNVIKQKEKTKK